MNPQFPMEIERILSKALEKDRELRYQNAAEIRADLKRRKRDGESSSMNALRIAPSTPVPPAAKRPQFWKWSTKAVIAVLSALLVGLAVFSFIQDRETTRGIVILQIRPLTSLPGLEIDPALSRDGKMLAYSGGTLARTDIYVRQVAGGNPINLTESMQGSHRWPQWSSDGLRIAFQSIVPGGASSISIVPSLGGIPKKLVDAPRPQLPVYSVPQLTGHALSPDGNTLAYAQGNAIYIVPLLGGEPKKLAELQAPHSLAWSPDGSRIAYVSGNATFVFGSALFANLAPSSIGVIDVAGGHPLTVTDNNYVNVSPVWMPDSRSILYISSRGGDRDVYLLAIGASGKPSQAPQRLTTGLNAHTISRSGDGKLLAYSALTTQSNIWSIPIPEHGPVSASEAKPVTTGNQTIEGISASRREPWLAFDSNRSGNQDIYRMRLPGGISEQLTSHASDDFLPSWSPDGKSLAFYSFRNGSRDLFVMTADGGHQEQLTSDPAQERYPDWSPDGARIVFYSDKTGREELYLISRKSDGSGWNMPRQLTLTGGIWPRWAPDGSLVAYIQNGLRVIDPDTGRDRLLVPNLETLRPQFAAWSNDSRTVYFKSADAENRASVWSVPAGGGEPKLLVRFDDSARPSYRPEFATDGRNFFFTLAERESDIRVMELAN
jgi:Tol biopolymer transport system component